MISSLSPTEGPTRGGQLVTLVGERFRLPFGPPPSGPSGPFRPSVRVFFGREEASRVWVFSEHEVRVITPAAPQGLVPVRLENMHPDGTPVLGEWTERQGYTYVRPDLSSAAKEGVVRRLVRTLLLLLREQVLENTSLTVHTDYDQTPEDALNLAFVAELPALILTGPRLSVARAYETPERRWERLPDGTVVGLSSSYTVNMEFTVMGMSDSTMELLRLMQDTAQFFAAHPYLAMRREEQDASLGMVRYEMDFLPGGDVQSTSAPNESNVRQFSSTVLVRGVDVEPEETSIADLAFPVGTRANHLGEPDVDLTWSIVQANKP